METVLIMMLVLLGIILMTIFYTISVYNKLVEYKNRFMNAFAQIDVQLQRRYDLIPNLIETAKGYMQYEKQTLTMIVDARNKAKTASDLAAQHPDDKEAIERLNATESALTSTMSKFFALTENYPDLKANQSMQQLMEELTSTENKVGFARQAYNDAVMIYNTYREQFPIKLLVEIFNFEAATHFEVADVESKKPVKVSFN
jgi:LemA protein